MDNKEIAVMCKAFCDENRVQILRLLQDGEKCACRILDALQISQPTLSHHMKILCDSGVVIGRKDGKWMHYSISAEGSETAAKYLRALTSVSCTDRDKSCCDE